MATYFNHSYVAGQRSNRWQDWANVLIAIWLFISPWVLQFGSGTAAWNAWILAVLVFLTALSAVGRMKMWQEWWNLIFGAWIFVAPWVLGFTRLSAASWDHWIVGALVFLIAASSLGATRPAPRTTVEPPMTAAERPATVREPPWSRRRDRDDRR